MNIIAQNGNDGAHYDLEESNKMEQSEFNKLVKETLAEIEQTLITKGSEYVRNSNVFHNFDAGSQRKGIIREKVLDGFLLKHEISIDDMVNDIEENKLPKIEKVNEKFGDLLVYNIIKKISIIDRIQNK